VALDLGWKILSATKADLGPKSVSPVQEKILEYMVVKNERFGRKNGKGFYDYDGKNKKLWSGLSALQSKQLDPTTLDIEELKLRLLVTQALEAAKTVEDGVIVDPREADVGSILGFGFAPYSGGTLSYIDGMGTKAFVAICEKLTKKHGARFKPNKLLNDMAAKGETFYGRMAKQKAA
jgi:3-hydroxyacyl-CoA dehydrogenase / enoyl-CoA hydratase / 3-hydroxybutyryl-CoA epimerase